MILVTPAGIGRPIDEAAVNKALFDRENVEVIGVVMNKVLPEKLESITDTARRGFERLGLELLGVIPREDMLEQTTLEQICDDIGGTFLHRGKYDRKRVAHVRIGAMSASNVFRGARERTLLVVQGDEQECDCFRPEAFRGKGIPILWNCSLGRYPAEWPYGKNQRVAASGGQFAARQLFDRKPDPFHEREDPPRVIPRRSSASKNSSATTLAFPDTTDR